MAHQEIIYRFPSVDGERERAVRYGPVNRTVDGWDRRLAALKSLAQARIDLLAEARCEMARTGLQVLVREERCLSPPCTERFHVGGDLGTRGLVCSCGNLDVCHWK